MYLSLNGIAENLHCLSRTATVVGSYFLYKKQTSPADERQALATAD
jgi:protein-tyrosine phosphatase